MIFATFSDNQHYRTKIAAPIVRQFYEENSAIETTIMFNSLGTLLITISGAFSNSNRSSPSPHPTNNVGRVYPECFPSFNFV